MNPTAAKKTPSFLLRPIAPPDEAFLLQLYATARAAELARTGWDATQRDVFIRSQYLARKADYTARFPSADQAIITLQGRDAGVWMVWRTKSEFRLINVELLPEYRGQGVGSTLLRGLLTEAKTPRLPVRLSVREDNLGAQRLYRRLGFSIEVRQNGYLVMSITP